MFLSSGIVPPKTFFNLRANSASFMNGIQDCDTVQILNKDEAKK